MIEMIVLVSSIIMGVSGVLMLVGFSADSAKCTACKYYGPKDFMNENVADNKNKTYTHRGCE